MNDFRNDIRCYNLNIHRLVKGFLTGHTFFLVRMYRRGNWYYTHGIRFVPDVIKKRMLRKFACEISPYATIGKGLKIHHSIGIVVGQEVIIGDNCEIFQNVTIGSNRKERNGRMMPIIGNNVSIGAGAVIVGAISIGDNVKIGANTYIDFDVPRNTEVHGSKGSIFERS